MADPINYQSPVPPPKPRRRWWLLILLLALVPFAALAFSILLIVTGYLGPGD